METGMTIRKENPDAFAMKGEGSGEMQVAFFTSEQDTRPDVSYLLSFIGVTITSHEPSWGSIPINGRDRLKTVRDGLIEACERFGIE